MKPKSRISLPEFSVLPTPRLRFFSEDIDEEIGILSKRSLSLVLRKNRILSGELIEETQVRTVPNWKKKVFPHTKSCQIAILCILEEAIDQLEILESLNGWPKGTSHFSYRSIEQRFAYNSVRDPDEIEQDAKYQTDPDIAKFQNDLAFVKRALTVAFEEIKVNEEIEDFVDIVTNCKLTQLDEEILLNEEKLNRLEFENLTNVLETEKLDFEEKIYNSMLEIGRLNDEIQDFEIESNIKTRFVTDWESSRKEMSEIQMKNKENVLQNEIHNANTNIERETRVHYELVAFLKESEQDLVNQLDNWIAKYDHDTENMDIKIQNLEENLLKLKLEQAQLEKEYEKRQKEMAEFKEYKEKKLQAELEEERRNKAAIKIQAWWRGVMFRKCLGKYRKNKKGKKKSGEKKKKKT